MLADVISKSRDLKHASLIVQTFYTPVDKIFSLMHA